MLKNLVSICSLGGEKAVKQTKNPETVSGGVLSKKSS